ncbi:MAG: redoxin family protein [Acidobacteria bacterium]|nr:redoxin family protein [Acidobacteriota bacterium]NIM63960.1 redoxin family protein [Acidobacteriota bacterium]NIO59365.1 redoxin family protein [Acidobacteriota bacterium]NIQ30401.1 redoxin family protein [Acidobacteriota bacterium]NIQ85327.1 redoxin family protein [Acidobacteriota bacterium]
MSKRFAFIGVLVLSLVCVAGCGAPDPPTGEEAAAASDAASTSGDRLAPEFTLARIGGGEQVSLADSAGRIRLVDFWTTWCPPCREEIPMLNELQQTYGERGFDVIAISPEEPDVLEEFAADNPVVYTSLIGTEDLVHEYGALGYPTGFLIDGDGYVVDVFFGPKPRRALEEKIEALLAES